MARSDLPDWYGSRPNCLPNEDRQWQRSIDSTPSSQKMTHDEYSNDTYALEWKKRSISLRNIAFIGASLLITAQVLVALCMNGEHVSLCKRPPKEIVLTIGVTLGLILILIQQQQVIVECEDIYARENMPRMLSWTAITLFMLGIAMFVGISPVVDWVHGVQERRVLVLARETEEPYDDLFSYQKGRSSCSKAS